METPEQIKEREKKEKEEGAAAAAAQTATLDEKKPVLVNVSALIQFSCPACGEVVNASDKEESHELELNDENKFRAELPAETGECDFCKVPVTRKKIVIAYL